jgi:hypothetical protein
LAVYKRKLSPTFFFGRLKTQTIPQRFFSTV